MIMQRSARTHMQRIAEDFQKALCKCTIIRILDRTKVALHGGGVHGTHRPPLDPPLACNLDTVTRNYVQPNTLSVTTAFVGATIMAE